MPYAGGAGCKSDLIRWEFITACRNDMKEERSVGGAARPFASSPSGLGAQTSRVWQLKALDLIEKAFSLQTTA